MLLGAMFANFLIVVPAFLVQPDIRPESVRHVAQLSGAISVVSLLALVVQVALLLRSVRPKKDTKKQVIIAACTAAVPGLIWGVFKLTAAPSAQLPARTARTDEQVRE